MSKIVVVTACCLAFGASSPGLRAQECVPGGSPSSFPGLKDIISRCRYEFPAPDGMTLVRVDESGRLSVRSPDNSVTALPRVEPPAMISWSPSSRAFLVNDGKSSGQVSVFRLFRMQAPATVNEDSQVAANAISRFRRERRCAATAADPHVWGFGWSADGSQVYLLVQAGIHEPCGQASDFVTMTVRLSDDAIVEQFSESATKNNRRFRALLPAELFSN